MEAEIKGMYHSPGTLEATRGWKRRAGLPTRASGGSMVVMTQISDSGFRDYETIRFCCFKYHVCGDLLQEPLEMTVFS